MNTLTLQEFNAILRNDLAAFIERVFYELNPQTVFTYADYIGLIAAKLEACHRGEIRRLIINIPPRYLKSICVSVALPAWYLGHYPNRHVICASYGQDLSNKFARDSRATMQAGWYQELFATRLADRVAVNDFSTTAQGSRLATSVGGVLTGRGADLIIIDDPLKPQDAYSESQRTTTNQWYDNTLLSRLNNKSTGCIIIVMQRLHQDDLVGHVLEQDEWNVLSLPAIATENESYAYSNILGNFQFLRNIGQPLNPDRESLEVLEGLKTSMSEYDFQSQYQQSPIPREGALIKSAWLKYYDTQPQFTEIYQSWDTAQKDSDTSHYSVCTTWGRHGDCLYLLDVLRERLNYPDLKKRALEQKKKFGARKALIEDKASGISLLQDLAREGGYGFIPCTPKPGMDKYTRLVAQSDLFEAGRIFLPESAPWLDCYKTELLGFPGTKFDDQIDSTSQALEYFKDGGRKLEIWKKLGR